MTNEQKPSQSGAVAQEKRRRDALSHYEQMADAQSRCCPCKLCGGRAVISDAGTGAGYYVRCENSGAFHAATGCMVTESRLGGWAYNVMDWWNRLHAHPYSAPVSDEAIVEAMWNALKEQCCVDPANATKCVMVTQGQFCAAIAATSLMIRAQAMSDSPLPEDVVRLVIAAREVAYDIDVQRHDDEARQKMSELDEAAEAFSSRVPWDDEPREVPATPTAGEQT